MSYTPLGHLGAARPKRRFYSPEFKTQVMQECCQSGASVAGVALSHGINANIVHRWLREQTPPALSVQSQAFVPVTLNDSAPGSASQAEPDIRSAPCTRTPLLCSLQQRAETCTSQAQLTPDIRPGISTSRAAPTLCFHAVTTTAFGLYPATLKSSVSMSTGFTKCASNPAAAVRLRSSGRP